MKLSLALSIVPGAPCALGAKVFNRLSTFYACQQIDPACNSDTETVAEIVVASDDGMMLAYSDSKREAIGEFESCCLTRHASFTSVLFLPSRLPSIH